MCKIASHLTLVKYLFSLYQIHHGSYADDYKHNNEVNSKSTSAKSKRLRKAKRLNETKASEVLAEGATE